MGLPGPAHRGPKKGREGGSYSDGKSAECQAEADFSVHDFTAQHRLKGNLPPNLKGCAAAFGGVLPSMPSHP